MLGDLEVDRACYIVTLKGKEKLVVQMLSLDSLEPVDHEKKLETNEGLEEISSN